MGHPRDAEPAPSRHPAETLDAQSRTFAALVEAYVAETDRFDAAELLGRIDGCIDAAARTRLRS